MVQEQVNPSTTLKLNDPVKVVKIPVSGQPGRYITGILPFERQEDDEAPAPPRKVLKPWMRTTVAIAIVIVVLTSLGIVTTIVSHNQPNAQQTSTQTTSQTLNNSPAAKATATANANILVSDPLDRNINNWLTQPTNLYAFKNGAYAVSDVASSTGKSNGNGVVLPGKSFDVPLTYTLTMQEIKGDDTTVNNTFGMIMRFNQQNKNGHIKTTFYTFEVENAKGKDYQFWRYDDNKTNPWSRVNGGNIPIGKEFHLGKASNTISITMNGSTFTVVVNGTKLSKVVHDTTFQNGSVGMIVNNPGTEVAFRNLLVTRQ